MLPLLRLCQPAHVKQTGGRELMGGLLHCVPLQQMDQRKRDKDPVESLMTAFGCCSDSLRWDVWVYVVNNTFPLCWPHIVRAGLRFLLIFSSFSAATTPEFRSWPNTKCAWLFWSRTNPHFVVSKKVRRDSWIHPLTNITSLYKPYGKVFSRFWVILQTNRQRNTDTKYNLLGRDKNAPLQVNLILSKSCRQMYLYYYQNVL